jgi:hypothetical protein
MEQDSVGELHGAEVSIQSYNIGLEGTVLEYSIHRPIRTTKDTGLLEYSRIAWRWLVGHQKINIKSWQKQLFLDSPSDQKSNATTFKAASITVDILSIKYCNNM